MLDREELDFLIYKINTLTDSQHTVKSRSSVSGGSINDAFQLITDVDIFFIKRNQKEAYPGMFEAEKKGLQLLSHLSELEVPRPLGVWNFEDRSYIIMTYVEEDRSNADDKAREFGRKLAKMHRQTADKFGLDHDNYMGSLAQRNTPCNTFPEFFVTRRLIPQIKLARDSGELISSHSARFERLFPQIEKLFPEERPAFIHGDLWGGNYMHTSNNTSVFDPAVSYSHRELDIAMTRLFGGFPQSFYSGYEEEYPLEPGSEERTGIANLYPLLIHVNLFGGGYLGQVEQILRSFT